MVLAEAGILGSVEVGVDRALVVHLQNKRRQRMGLISILKERGARRMFVCDLNV